jgi:hypothetical protein
LNESVCPNDGWLRFKVHASWPGSGGDAESYPIMRFRASGETKTRSSPIRSYTLSVQLRLRD